MKVFRLALLLSLACLPLAQGAVDIPGGGVTRAVVTNIVNAIGGGAGGATNGIQMLNGNGTNTTLISPNINLSDADLTGSLSPDRITATFSNLPIYYVDRVNGADTNSGRTPQAAWFSIARLSNTLNSVEIRLARGSHWREQLTLGTNNIVRAYGSGPLPILDASDVATNSLWAKEGSTSNVWKYTFVPVGGIGSYLSVVEDGVQLINTNSIANCATTPGTFFTTNAFDVTAGSTNIVFIHPRASTSPTNDAKLYEIAKRLYGLYGGNNNSVINVHTRNNGGNNGSIELRRDGYMENVIAENGTKHNVFLASGVARRVTAWKQEFSLQSATLFVSHDTVDGGSVHYEDCLALGATNATAYFSHTEGAGYGFQSYVNCVADTVGSWGSPGIATTGTAYIVRPRGRNLVSTGISFFGGTNVCISPDMQVAGSGTTFAIGYTSTSGMLWISDGLFGGSLHGIRVDGSTNVFVTLVNNNVQTLDAGGQGVATVSSSNVVVTLSNNIVAGFPAFSIGTGNTLAGADYNVYPGASQFTIDGVTHVSFAAYRAAHPTLDVNSTDAGLQALGDPAQGDFSYASTSPAVTNQAGTGWRIPRLPLNVRKIDGVDIPSNRKLAAGIDTTGRFNSYTNAAAQSLFVLRQNGASTNQVITGPLLSGPWTNTVGSSDRIQISSIGNVSLDLVKSSTGNSTDVRFYGGSTLQGSVALGTDSSFGLKTHNDNPLVLHPGNAGYLEYWALEHRFHGAGFERVGTLYGGSVGQGWKYTLHGTNGLRLYAGSITNAGDYYGSLLTATNFSWTNLVDVPAGFADGTDDGGAGSQTNIVAGFSNRFSIASIAASNVFEVLTTNATKAVQISTNADVRLAGALTVAGAVNLPAESLPTSYLPANVDLSGKTSVSLPVGATPAVDAVGKLAFDNNFYASGRGAWLSSDGTVATFHISIPVTNLPTAGTYSLAFTAGNFFTLTPAAAGTVTNFLFPDGNTMQIVDGDGNVIISSDNANNVTTYSSPGGDVQIVMDDDDDSITIVGTVTFPTMNIGNATATNLYTLITNAAFLNTDANGKLQAATALSSAVTGATAATTDNDTSLATTAYVKANLNSTNFTHEFHGPISTNFTVTLNNKIVACFGTNQVITLPNGTNGPVAKGTAFTFLMSSTTGSGSASITNANGVQTVRTAAGLNQVITNGQSFTAIWDGSNWR